MTEKMIEKAIYKAYLKMSAVVIVIYGAVIGTLALVTKLLNKKEEKEPLEE